MIGPRLPSRTRERGSPAMSRASVPPGRGPQAAGSHSGNPLPSIRSLALAVDHQVDARPGHLDLADRLAAVGSAGQQAMAARGEAVEEEAAIGRARRPAA